MISEFCAVLRPDRGPVDQAKPGLRQPEPEIPRNLAPSLNWAKRRAVARMLPAGFQDPAPAQVLQYRDRSRPAPEVPRSLASYWQRYLKIHGGKFRRNSCPRSARPVRSAVRAASNMKLGSPSFPQACCSAHHLLALARQLPSRINALEFREYLPPWLSLKERPWQGQCGSPRSASCRSAHSHLPTVYRFSVKEGYAAQLNDSQANSDVDCPRSPEFVAATFELYGECHHVVAQDVRPAC